VAQNGRNKPFSSKIHQFGLLKAPLATFDEALGQAAAEPLAELD